MSTDIIYVEYQARVLVEVDLNAETITNAIINTKDVAATGDLFASPGSSADWVPAVVPTPPPKFNSPEEADAWLEANVGKTKADAVEITQDEHDKALLIAQDITWDAWL